MRFQLSGKAKVNSNVTYTYSSGKADQVSTNRENSKDPQQSIFPTGNVWHFFSAREKVRNCEDRTEAYRKDALLETFCGQIWSWHACVNVTHVLHVLRAMLKSSTKIVLTWISIDCPLGRSDKWFSFDFFPFLPAGAIPNFGMAKGRDTKRKWHHSSGLYSECCTPLNKILEDIPRTVEP